jgi:hypothetical protein
MTKANQTSQLNWPRWQQALLIALLVLVIGNRMMSLLDAAASRAGLLGEIAYVSGSQINDPAAPPGFGKMVDVVPGGAFARAGVREGDYVRTDPSYQRALRPVVGETLNFTLDRHGVRSEGQIIIEPVPTGDVQEQDNFRRLLNLLAAIVSILVGCFILWRGWGNKTAMLLGAALVMLGRGGSAIPGWASDSILAIPMWWTLTVGFTTSALVLPFGLRMFEASAGPLPRWHWHLARIWLAWCATSMAIFGWDRIALTNYLAWAGGMAYGTLLAAISCCVSVPYLVAGWNRAAATERSRFALIIFALTAYAVTGLVTGWEATRTGVLFADSGQAWLIYFNALLTGVVAPGLLAYAVLRHKLFDLGFAVNRTLVFGAIGGLLLVSFALIEWGIKQAIPKVWYGGSVYISALIAVGLYLTFNRLHHRVEHAIERLFFRNWQLNETALKRFVAAAAHVEKPEALSGHFVTELGRFTGGAAVLLYARTPEGNYASAAGDEIDADDPALSAMRAERGEVVPAELGSPLQAALALPMMHQAALAGFVLLGPKPTGEDYRPDEIEILGWATQQVGLDLQGIRVRDLEQTVTRLEVQNGSLESHNRNLTDILAGKQTASASGRTK